MDCIYSATGIHIAFRYILNLLGLTDFFREMAKHWSRATLVAAPEKALAYVESLIVQKT